LNYKKTQISDAVAFSSVIDKKFTTNRITVRFLTELNKTTASLNSVAFMTLTDTNAKYKTIAELSKKLNSLYGANLKSNSHKAGDIQVLEVSISAILSKFALGDEDILAESADILLDCIFSPNIVDGEFENSVFGYSKKDLLDTIESEINNKRSYAINKACEVIYENEPCSTSSYGTKETATAVTPKAAYEQYKTILATAQVEISFVGGEESDVVFDKFKAKFDSLTRNPKEVSVINFSKIKPEIAEKSMSLDVNQTKMVLAFKSNTKDVIKNKLTSTIFGGTPSSKLFMNVREKLSLCYYCASGYSYSKGTLLVDCGIEKDKIDQTREEILRQFDDIKAGNVTDTEFTNALLATINNLKSIGDSVNSVDMWYFDEWCKNPTAIKSPHDTIDLYKALTKEDITENAKTFTLDTVFTMVGDTDANTNTDGDLNE
jgi:predicted Zn-dependent peptidase